MDRGKRLGRGCLNLFLKTDCILCHRPNSTAICGNCQQQLGGRARSRPLDILGPLAVFAWGEYEGGLKRSILAMKYDGHSAVGEMLGQWLGRSWRSAGLPPLALVPIPMHEAKRRERGYNQAELIAQGFGQVTGQVVDSQLLVRSRSTTAQHGLSLSDRRANLRSAFSIDPRRRHGRPMVLLVDDIYTTGATAIEARQTLTDAGFTVWGIAVAAR
jgi:ComF family protein